MSIWDNHKRKALRLVLQKVYPSYEELALFVSEATDENLASITGNKRLPVAVYDLLQWAQKEPRKLDELFEAFCKDNPNHPDIPLIEYATTLDVESADKTLRRSFITSIKNQLIQEELTHDLSRNIEFSEFQFIGYKETLSTVDLVALVEADGLTERQIVDLRNQFFEAVQAVSYDFGLRPLARNPNGLLAFVFEKGCSSVIASFIEKQSRASSFGKSAVMVSWAVDVPEKKIYTHSNPVSIMPPIWILEQTVFPGLNFISRALEQYIEPDS